MVEAATQGQNSRRAETRRHVPARALENRAPSRQVDQGMSDEKSVADRFDAVVIRVFLIGVVVGFVLGAGFVRVFL